MKVTSDVSDEVLLERLEHFWGKQCERDTELTETSIAFHSPYWKIWLGRKWSALAFFEKGRFWIDRDFEDRVLNFELRSLHSLFVLLLMTFAFFAYGVSSGDVETAIVLGLIWLVWMLLLDAIFERIRILPAIRRIIEGK